MFKYRINFNFIILILNYFKFQIYYLIFLDDIINIIRNFTYNYEILSLNLKYNIQHKNIVIYRLN